MICVPDSPYAEDVERRLRDRAAVMHALCAEGYVPRHSKTLNYVVADDGSSADTACLLSHSRPCMRGGCYCAKILVVWVGDDLLNAAPLQGLAGIVSQLVPSNQDDTLPEVRVLGPSSSGQYRKILEELERPSTRNTARLLSRAQIYSCKAAGAEAVLREGIGWLASAKVTTAAAIQKALRHGFEDSKFVYERTLVTDKESCEALRAELQVRGIEQDAHVAVLSELDSFYGRASTETFIGYSNPHAANVRSYTYMAGIDGALPKNALGLEERSGNEQSSGANGPAPLQEPTEGQSQIDYFRRLAETLADYHKHLVAADGKGFRAIVVLGGDTYDKLQILRRLRPRLPVVLSDQWTRRPLRAPR